MIILSKLSISLRNIILTFHRKILYSRISLINFFQKVSDLVTFCLKKYYNMKEQEAGQKLYQLGEFLQGIIFLQRQQIHSNKATKVTSHVRKRL